MKKSKVIMFLIMVAAIGYFATQPPVKGLGQETPKAQVISPQVQHLQKVLDKKSEELKQAIKETEPETKIVYRTKYVHVPPKEITVYIRINGEVTEHKVKNDNGFYVLDLKPETETNVVTETYYIDTCINEQKRTLWRQLFGK